MQVKRQSGSAFNFWLLLIYSSHAFSGSAALEVSVVNLLPWWACQGRWRCCRCCRLVILVPPEAPRLAPIVLARQEWHGGKGEWLIPGEGGAGLCRALGPASSTRLLRHTLSHPEAVQHAARHIHTHLHAAALSIRHVHIPPLPLVARPPLPPPAAAATSDAACLPLLLDDCIQVTPLLATALAFPVLCLLSPIVVLPASRAAAAAPHFVAPPPAAALLILAALLSALLPLLLLLPLPPAALPPAATLLAATSAQPQAAGGHVVGGLHIFNGRDAEDERDGCAGLVYWAGRGQAAEQLAVS